MIIKQLTPAALLVASALSVSGCKDAGSAVVPVVERPVLVQRVAYEDSISERRFVGTIAPRVESDLGFRVQGKVLKRLVNVGDVVHTGQVLAQLDEVDLKLQSEQAEAERRTAAVSLEQSEADLKRTLTLSTQGWTAAAVVDKQKSATEEARSRLLRAMRALTLAENAFSYAALTADADGVITATSIEPGQVVAPGQAAIRLARTAEKEAVVALPEAYVGRAREGHATVSLWSDAKVRLPATLRELSPSADAMSRTFLARFSLPTADASVRLGMTATVTLTGGSTARVARLPLSALFNQGAGPDVWVVDDKGDLSLRPITVASYQAQDVLVSDGVRDGDRVVKLGAQKLDQTQRVHVVDALQF